MPDERNIHGFVDAFNAQGFVRLEADKQSVWSCSKVRRCLRDFVASIDSQVESFSA